MFKRLQVALMATSTAISFLSIMFSPAFAQSGITSTTDDAGRKIYVNADATTSNSAPSRGESSATARSALVYWSATEHRFKPVPTNGAVMRAARSAASEVSTFLDAKVQKHQTLNRAFTPQEINAAIDEAAARHHVDPSLVRSVVKVESNFNPNAVSPKGAMGLMQLMPSTARSLNVANPFDPAQNVDAGVRHLRKLLDSYGGNVSLTLAAYNAGSGAVARSAGVPHFRETMDYVRRITNLYNGGGEPWTYASGSHFTAAPVQVQRDSRGMLYISNTE
ncbi:MAG: lytic transglycosylase domain-containing protein [Terriglobales bacterium]